MRKYFKCTGCGKNTWVNTEGLFKDRDKCKDCYVPPDLDGVHHCITCGSFAQYGSKYCWRCQRLATAIRRVDELKAELQDEQIQNTTCQLQNKGLKDSVTSLSKKLKKEASLADQPFRVNIYGWQGTCSEAYLKKVLMAAEIVPSVFKVEYSRRKGA